MHAESGQRGLQRENGREESAEAQRGDKGGEADAVAAGAAQIADLVELTREHAADHHADTEPEAEQRDGGVVGEFEGFQAEGLEVHFHHRAANPEERGAEQDAAEARGEEERAGVVEEFGDAAIEAHGGIVGRGEHREIQRGREAEDREEHGVTGERGEGVDEFGAGDAAEENGDEGEHFDGAIGFHEAFAGEDFREDSVFRRRVNARADADDEVADGLPVVVQREAKRADAGAEELDGIAAEEPARLGKTVVEEARERREQHVGNEEQRRVNGVRGAEVLRGDRALLELEGELPEDDGEDHVVAERAEELADEEERIIARGIHDFLARGCSARRAAVSVTVARSATIWAARLAERSPQACSAARW